MSKSIPSPIDHERLDTFQSVCRQQGVKLTPQRLEIFREVTSSTSHPDAEAVYREVKARVPSISLDTVYRTLWLLTELGLITTLGTRQEAIRFDANLKPHHHYICVRCGSVYDVETSILDEEKVKNSINRLGSILESHVEVRGLCKLCAESNVT